MSKTLSQLRSTVLALLREDSTNAHFTDSVLNGFINEGMEFATVFIEYPRDLVSVTTELNVGSYANPSDNLLIRTVYFGNPAVAGDMRPVKFVTEETLKEIYPSWLDNTASSQSDRPEYCIQLDRKTVSIFPRPNAAGAGKKLWLNYNYVPATMSADADVPDLPLPYHNLLPLYALHLCYIALQNVPLAKEMFAEFMDKVQRLKNSVTKESKENLSFSWGNDDDVGVNSFGGVIP